MGDGMGMPGTKKVEPVDEEVANDEFFEILSKKRKIVEIDPTIVRDPSFRQMVERVERLEHMLEKLHTALLSILPKENIWRGP